MHTPLTSNQRLIEHPIKLTTGASEINKQTSFQHLVVHYILGHALKTDMDVWRFYGNYKD